jgi:dipeptidyl aminopeptidase/acylaminoacyl peptidase
MLDEIVPYTESVRTHRALLACGVRSELVLLRNEGHALRSPAIARDWLNWVLTACARTIPATVVFS